jgi:hypothetical protein
MPRKSQLPDQVIKYVKLNLLFAIMLNGCAPSGIIIDREQFETPVKKMYLKEYPYLKICHGGILQQIPLRQIQLIKIDPASSILYENELYYGADLIFKNGGKINTSKDNVLSAYVSVENTVIGKSKEQSFLITLDNVKQIKIQK